MRFKMSLCRHSFSLNPFINSLFRIMKYLSRNLSNITKNLKNLMQLGFKTYVYNEVLLSLLIKRR